MLAIHITVILNAKLLYYSHMVVGIGYIEQKHEKQSYLSSFLLLFSRMIMVPIEICCMFGLLRAAAGQLTLVLIRSERDGGVTVQSAPAGVQIA